MMKSGNDKLSVALGFMMCGYEVIIFVISFCPELVCALISWWEAFVLLDKCFEDCALSSSTGMLFFAVVPTGAILPAGWWSCQARACPLSAALWAALTSSFGKTLLSHSGNAVMKVLLQLLDLFGERGTLSNVTDGIGWSILEKVFSRIGLAVWKDVNLDNELILHEGSQVRSVSLVGNVVDREPLFGHLQEERSSA